MKAFDTLVLGTTNAGKAAELRALLAPLGIALPSLADLGAPLAIDESSGALAENARLKAALQARHLGAWVLADDTGLEVEALGGAPGARAARYAGPDADAAANRHKLLRELAHIPEAGREARFVCALAVADPEGTVRAVAAGVCRGRIGYAPVGDRGFGYDALFVIVEYRRTLAELGPAAGALLTHRARAVQAILPQLRRLASTTR